MKKTVFLVFALIAFAAAPALCQEVKGSEAKALVHLEKGELDMAKKEIEAFFDNPKNVKKVVKGKPWATKARIYKAIAISDKPEFQSLLDNPVQATLECFNKVKEYEKEGSLVYVEVFGSAPELQGTPLSKLVCWKNFMAIISIEGWKHSTTTITRLLWSLSKTCC